MTGGKIVGLLGMAYVDSRFVRLAGLIVTMVDGSGSAGFGVAGPLVDTGRGDAVADTAFANKGAIFNDDRDVMVPMAKGFCSEGLPDA